MPNRTVTIDVRLISEDALASAMDFNGITVRELAERTGINRSTIGHLRSGKRRNCSAKNASKIAKALHTAPNLLFERRVLRTPCNTAHKLVA